MKMMMRNAQLIFRFILGVSLVVIVLNLMALSQHDIIGLSSRHWRTEFLQQPIHILSDNQVDPRSIGSFSYVSGSGSDSDPSTTDAVTSSGSSMTNEFRRSRTLVGILTADTRTDYSYRRRHRQLFQIWNDTRVCSLGQLRHMPALKRKQCQLVYTFVLGAATHPDSPTLLVNASLSLFREGPFPSKNSDVHDDDVTLLNIKENMNDGKSPTFFYFASTILEEYNLDYAMKLDGDSLLHLHDWFLFAHHHLPPRPLAKGIAGGALRHKAFWPAPTNPQDKVRLESYWEEQYESVHLYLAGQCYFMTLDLCRVVAQEASVASTKIAPGGYLEGHEDHDVSSMLFQSTTPIHLITIGKSQRFWEHPVKGQPRWDRIRKREEARMKGELFEGKQLRLYLDE